MAASSAASVAWAAPDFALRRHASEQYFTSAQSRSHFLRHWISRPHTTHVFAGTPIGRTIQAMMRALLPILLVLLVPTLPANAQKWAIAIHGGAGEAEWVHMDPATAAAYHASLAKALDAGQRVLAAHGKALDAVEAAIEVLEDDPLFNAGRGAAFTAEGRNEMDASVMDGETLDAGIRSTRHPIALARAVMEHSPYVMLAGPGADAFAKAQQLEQQPPRFFFTEMRWQEFTAVMRAKGKPVPPRPDGAPPVPASAAKPGRHFGTVGAVARDEQGHLAAGTSTGGAQGKLPGRVGDSPIIGAGTYASDRSCAVSGTGVGEFFIRLTLARQVCTLVEQGQTPQGAADRMIHVELPALRNADGPGEGGVIVLGRTGPPVWSNNTLGIFHAQRVAGGPPEVWVK